MMSSPNRCVVVCVNVLGWGQVEVISTQNRCVVVCVNVLGWGQTKDSREANISCFSWLSSILSIVRFLDLYDFKVTNSYNLFL